MEPSFLQRYLEAFRHIEGWFTYDAALLFMAYNELIARQGIAGDVLEIGVHHGLSAIATASLRGPGKRFIAADLFEQMQDKNVSCSGGGNRTIFEQNMQEFYPDTSFMQVIEGPSNSLDPSSLGTSFSFCHVDAGHSRQETLDDLNLSHPLLAPGGLVALDDYFNAEYPGVCEGAVEFNVRRPGALRPLAIAYNKTVFQKAGSSEDLNAKFLAAVPDLPYKIVTMWDTSVLLITSPLRYYLDLYSSTPSRLVRRGAVRRVCFEPAQAQLEASPGQPLTLPVTITNVSDEAFPAGERVCGLSYHLLSADGEVLRADHDRSWLTTALVPGETRTLPLSILAPGSAGRYQLEIDLVWENLMWFKDVGNPTAMVELNVREP